MTRIVGTRTEPKRQTYDFGIWNHGIVHALSIQSVSGSEHAARNAQIGLTATSKLSEGE